MIAREPAYSPAEAIVDADGLQALIDCAGAGRLVFAIQTPGWVPTPTM